jgi:hypothetical protein
MASSVGARLAFEKAKQGVKSAGYNLGTAVLSQSYLRSEVLLTTTQTLYTFPILVNDNSVAGGITNTSNLLALQDAFYCSELALYFAVPGSSTASNYALNSYPNATTFPAGADDELYSIYNGKMSIIINNRQIVPSLDLYRFYDAEQTQAPAVANAKDQFSGKMTGKYVIEPGIVFVGSKQNIVQISIPNALASVTAGSRMILYMVGHLAQNITPVR